MRQFRPRAALIAITTATRFKTGRAPGNPRQTGQVLTLGASPKRVEHEQNNLDFVRSCAWHSRPMTASYFMRGLTLAHSARRPDSRGNADERRRRRHSEEPSLPDT